MYSIKLNTDDTIFDKVMFFLNSIPKRSLEVKKLDESEHTDDENLGDFFVKSPLKEDVVLKRDKEVYRERVEF